MMNKPFSGRGTRSNKGVMGGKGDLSSLSSALSSSCSSLSSLSQESLIHADSKEYGSLRNSPISVCRQVCKAWAIASFKHLARTLSVPGKCQELHWQGWAKFARRYNWGRFLNQGACKEVYCVQNAETGALEVVSVMDILDLRERDMELAISQELEASMLCSALVSLNICPNLLLVRSMFQSAVPPPTTLWKSGRPRPSVSDSQSLSVPVPNKKQMMPFGLFQYIRMEFCRGGDLEELVRKQGLLSLDSVRNMLFQMFFAMYSGREQLCLRHFDLKLLNFFVSSGMMAICRFNSHRALLIIYMCIYLCLGSALLPDKVRNVYEAANDGRAQSPFLAFQDEAVVRMHVYFGDIEFLLPISANGLELIKMSDFGTSVVGPNCMGEPITIQQVKSELFFFLLYLSSFFFLDSVIDCICIIV
jgi:serine/threonine protein kinase